jgi:hypothetical protein
MNALLLRNRYGLGRSTGVNAGVRPPVGVAVGCGRSASVGLGRGVPVVPAVVPGITGRAAPV